MNERYSRQLLMEEVGEAGQEKLKNAKVLVVGAGGLGCPVLVYLACAGVGFLRVIDHDIISESNLNRQFLYGPEDIGKAKALTAKKQLLRQNPDIEVDAVHAELTEANIAQLLEDIDIVVDCVDNITTRLILNSACLERGIALIEGGVEGFYGFAAVIDRSTACLECMGFYEDQSSGPAPVIGITAGIIGMLEANACICCLLGHQAELLGHILQYDGIKQTLRKVKVKINPCCGVHKRIL